MYLNTVHVLLFIMLTLLREYEYICLLTAESRCTIIGSDLDNYFQYVDFDHSASYVKLIQEQVSTPLCAQITPGVVTLLSSEGVVYTITGDKFFKRMGAAPFVFAVNVDLHTMSPHPGGVCSLKVEWSC